LTFNNRIQLGIAHSFADSTTKQSAKEPQSSLFFFKKNILSILSYYFGYFINGKSY